MNYSTRLPIITYVLIGICVLCYIPVATNTLPNPNPFALYLPSNPNFHYWQYVTSMFMHGGVTHILFNMLGLWMFGAVLERAWGSVRFFIFYMLCGIGAGLIYNWVNMYQFNDMTQQLQALGLTATDFKQLLEQGLYRNNVPGLSEKLASDYYQFYHMQTVGASGAIYGILAAYAICFPNQKLMLIFIPYPIAAKYFVPVILIIELLSGVTGFSIFGEGIAHFAHLGGAVVGAVLVFFLGNVGTQRHA